jgi:hypothetical protein
MEEVSDIAYYPESYPLVQAAKYLGVAPWELLEQPIFWRNQALLFMTAEAQAQEQRQQMLNQGH